MDMNQATRVASDESTSDIQEATAPLKEYIANSSMSQIEKNAHHDSLMKLVEDISQSNHYRTIPAAKLPPVADIPPAEELSKKPQVKPAKKSKKK